MNRECNPNYPHSQGRGPRKVVGFGCFDSDTVIYDAGALLNRLETCGVGKPQNQRYEKIYYWDD
jgi:hypothetical protein